MCPKYSRAEINDHPTRFTHFIKVSFNDPFTSLKSSFIILFFFLNRCWYYSQLSTDLLSWFTLIQSVSLHILKTHSSPVNYNYLTENSFNNYHNIFAVIWSHDSSFNVLSLCLWMQYFVNLLDNHKLVNNDPVISFDNYCSSRGSCSTWLLHPRPGIEPNLNLPRQGSCLDTESSTGNPTS